MGRIFLWNPATGDCEQVLRSEAICRDGYPDFHLAADAELGRVIEKHKVRDVAIYDIDGWKRLCVGNHHGEEVHAAAFVAEDRVVTVSGDSTACLWDAWTGEAKRSLDTFPLYALAQHPSGGRLAIGGGSGYVAVIDGRSLKVETSQRLTMKKEKHEPLREERKKQIGIVWDRPSDTICALAWHPDGEHLVCGGWDFVPKLLEVRTGRVVRSFMGHAHWVNAVAVDAQGRRLVTASSDGTLRVWSLSSGECIAVFDLGHSDIGGVLVHEEKIYASSRRRLVEISLPP
jgi:WD40 repeat protein